MGQFWVGVNSQPHTGESLAWLPPNAGHFVLHVVNEAGQSDSRDINVELVP